MNKLSLSREAIKDLHDISDYITDELENPEAAQRIVAGITGKLHLLEQHSEIGARLESITGFGRDYRYLICGNYYVFYRVDADHVYVDRVLYRRRDFMRALFGIQENQ